MEKTQLTTFRRLHSLEEAQALTSELGRLGFKAELVRDDAPAGEAIVGTGVNAYRVQLDPTDFIRAEQALEQVDAGEEKIPSGYYLVDFTDQELVDVVMKLDEWGAYDRRLARKLLADRGKPLSDELVSIIRQQRIEDLGQPASPQTGFIVLGYISSILGGLLGVAIGYHLNTAKKILPNGERVYAYRGKDRWHGKRMFFLGLAIFIPLVIIKVILWVNTG